MRKNILISFIALLFLVGCNKENSNTSTNTSSSNSSGFYVEKFAKLNKITTNIKNTKKEILKLSLSDPNRAKLSKNMEKLEEDKKRVAIEIWNRYKPEFIKLAQSKINENIKVDKNLNDLFSDYYDIYINEGAKGLGKRYINDVGFIMDLKISKISNLKTDKEIINALNKDGLKSKIYGFLYLVEFNKILKSKITPICDKLSKEFVLIDKERRKDLMLKLINKFNDKKFNFEDEAKFALASTTLTNGNELKEKCLNFALFNDKNLVELMNNNAYLMNIKEKPINSSDDEFKIELKK